MMIKVSAFRSLTRAGLLVCHYGLSQSLYVGIRDLVDRLFVIKKIFMLKKQKEKF